MTENIDVGNTEDRHWLAPFQSTRSGWRGINRRERNVVIVRVMGGLGNQMFQYAAARSLAVRRNAALKLDALHFAEPGCPRTFDLRHLAITACHASTSEIAWLAHTREIAQLERQRKLQRLLRIARRPYWNHYREPHFQFDANFPSLKTPVYLEGGWQSEKYFSAHADTIRRELTPLAPLDAENQRVSDQIRATTSISLHVRRGDYLGAGDAAVAHGTCSSDYYHRALAYLQARLQNAHVFVFSDEPNWAREHLNISLPMTIVDLNPGSRSYRDMQLMSMCQHHIIANSSFSWWGAWLNGSEDKIVIAPERWFKSGLDTRDLLPPNWVRF